MSDRAKSALWRLGAFALAFALAPLVAAAYGALHDQVSFTLAPEYFTHLKFDQFAIAPALHGRVGAALVGVYATWWLGPPIGLVLGATLALRRPPATGRGRAVVRRTAAAFVVVLGVAALFGAAGYAVGVLQSAELVARWRIPTGVTDPEAFVRVGALHNGSYLGGAAGLAVAALVQLAAWWRERGLRA